jgi:hypothetical protein
VIELLIQELVLLVQRSEEYTYFLTSHMRDAVTRESESQQAAAAAAAQRAAHLQRRLSGAGPTHDAATAAGGGKDAAGVAPARLAGGAGSRCTTFPATFPAKPCVMLGVLLQCWTPPARRCSSTWVRPRRGCAQVGPRHAPKLTPRTQASNRAAQLTALLLH